MAWIENSDSGEQIILRGYHRFGRGEDNSIHTTLDDIAVSRTHSAIQWDSKRWHIIDLNSRNGCWLNGEKLQTNQSYPVELNSIVQFGGAQKPAWRFLSIDPPRAHLAPLNSRSTPIELETTNTLDPHSKICIRKAKDNKWILVNGETSDCLSDGQLIQVNDRAWRFVDAAYTEETEYLGSQPVDLSQVKFILHVSQNEEHIELSVCTDQGTTRLRERSFFYLFYLLATELKKDIEKEQAHPSEVGWMYKKEELCPMLNVSDTHLNIMIYRIRDLLKKEFPNIVGINNIIAGRTSQVRLSIDSKNLKIQKPGI